MNRRREMLKSRAKSFNVPLESIPITTGQTAINEILSSVGRVSTPGYVSGRGVGGQKLAKLSSSKPKDVSDPSKKESASKMSNISSRGKSRDKDYQDDEFSGYGSFKRTERKKTKENSKILRNLELNKEKYKIDEQDPIFERVSKVSYAVRTTQTSRTKSISK